MEKIVFVFYTETQNNNGNLQKEKKGEPLMTEKNNEVQNLECSFLVMDPVRRKEVWRFITYMLLHANHQHIGYNILMQLLIGNLVYITSNQRQNDQ